MKKNLTEQIAKIEANIAFIKEEIKNNNKKFEEINQRISDTINSFNKQSDNTKLYLQEKYLSKENFGLILKRIEEKIDGINKRLDKMNGAVSENRDNITKIQTKAMTISGIIAFVVSILAVFAPLILK